MHVYAARASSSAAGAGGIALPGRPAAGTLPV